MGHEDDARFCETIVKRSAVSREEDRQESQAGRQQGDHVRADRELDPREDFFGHRGSAEDVAALEDEDGLARAGEVGPRRRV